MSADRREKDRRYEQTDKAKERQDRYRRTAKGRARMAQAQARYRRTAKGRDQTDLYKAIRGYVKNRERVLLQQRAQTEKELECLERQTNC